METVKSLFPEIFVTESLKLDHEGWLAKYLIGLTNNGPQPWITFNQLDFELGVLCLSCVDIGYREADGGVLYCSQQVDGKEIWTTLARYRVFNNDHNLVWCPNLIHLKQLYKEWESTSTHKRRNAVVVKQTYQKEFITEFLQLTEELDNHLSDHISNMIISEKSLNPWSTIPLPLNSTSITTLKFDVAVVYTDRHTKEIRFLDEGHDLTLVEAREYYARRRASDEDGKFMWRPNANSLLKLHTIWLNNQRETKMKEPKPLFPTKFIVEALLIQAADPLYGYLVAMKASPDSRTSWMFGQPMKYRNVGEIKKFDVGTRHSNNENVVDCKYAVTFEEIQRYYSRHTGSDLQGQVVWRPNRDSLIVSYHEWVENILLEQEPTAQVDENDWLKKLGDKIVGVSAHSINDGIGFGIGVGKTIAKQMIEEAATNMKAVIESVDMKDITAENLKNIFKKGDSKPADEVTQRAPKIGDFIVFEYDDVVRLGYIDSASETHFYVDFNSNILKVPKDNGEKFLFGEWEYETPSDMYISIVDSWYKRQEAAGKELGLDNKFFSGLFRLMFWGKK